MTYAERVNEFERALLRKALRKTRGNMSQAARLLEMHRNTMISRCNALGVDPSVFYVSDNYDTEATRKRREKLRAAGLCLDCGKVPSGGEGGTPSLCPKCAQAHRSRDAKRRAENPRPKKFVEGITPRPLDQVFKKKALEKAAKEADKSLPIWTPKTRELLRLAALMPKSSINVNDLRRQAVC